MKFLFFLFFITLTFSATAQQKDSISYKQFLFSYKYKNTTGKRLWPWNLKPILLSRPESREYFLKYNREQWIANVSGAGGLGLLLIGSSREQSGKYFGKINPYKAAGAVLLAGSIYFSFHALNQQYKAVKAYNKAVF